MESHFEAQKAERISGLMRSIASAIDPNLFAKEESTSRDVFSSIAGSLQSHSGVYPFNECTSSLAICVACGALSLLYLATKKNKVREGSRRKYVIQTGNPAGGDCSGPPPFQPLRSCLSLTPCANLWSELCGSLLRMLECMRKAFRARTVPSHNRFPPLAETSEYHP